jgi:hypothetical protein
MITCIGWGSTRECVAGLVRMTVERWIRRCVRHERCGLETFNDVFRNPSLGWLVGVMDNGERFGIDFD